MFNVDIKARECGLKKNFREDRRIFREENFFNCEKEKNNREEVASFGAIRFDLCAIRFRLDAIKFLFFAIKEYSYAIINNPYAIRF